MPLLSHRLSTMIQPRSATPRTIVVTLGLAGLALPGLALAHVHPAAHVHVHGGLHAFVQGAVHPLTGLDHLAAMVSVGLWGALNARDTGGAKGRTTRLWALPAAFATALLAGALLGMAGLSAPGIEPMIAASLLILGLLVAARARLPQALSAGLVAGFAVFHGLAHGQELPGHAVPALAGMVLATAALHLGGILAGLGLRDAGSAPRRWATRLAGLAVAGLGAGLLAPSLALAFPAF